MVPIWAPLGLVPIFSKLAPGHVGLLAEHFSSSSISPGMVTVPISSGTASKTDPARLYSEVEDIPLPFPELLVLVFEHVVPGFCSDLLVLLLLTITSSSFPVSSLLLMMFGVALSLIAKFF